jgi:hypothetical protein
MNQTTSEYDELKDMSLSNIRKLQKWIEEDDYSLKRTSSLLKIQGNLIYQHVTSFPPVTNTPSPAHEFVKKYNLEAMFPDKPYSKWLMGLCSITTLGGFSIEYSFIWNDTFYRLKHILLFTDDECISLRLNVDGNKQSSGHHISELEHLTDEQKDALWWILENEKELSTKTCVDDRDFQDALWRILENEKELSTKTCVDDRDFRKGLL